jgi:hypothetical protein
MHPYTASGEHEEESYERQMQQDMTLHGFLSTKERKAPPLRC